MRLPCRRLRRNSWTISDLFDLVEIRMPRADSAVARGARPWWRPLVQSCAIRSAKSMVAAARRGTAGMARPASRCRALVTTRFDSTYADNGAQANKHHSPRRGSVSRRQQWGRVRPDSVGFRDCPSHSCSHSHYWDQPTPVGKVPQGKLRPRSASSLPVAPSG